MSNQIEPYVIRVGFGCNNNCKFCLQSKRSPFMRSAQAIQKELLNAREQKFSYVIFEGGEATLRKDIFNLIEFANAVGFEKTDLQSNGRLFCYKRICKKFINSGIDFFACALHARSAKIHDFLTSTPGSFKESVKGIKNLKDLGQSVGNQLVISKVNFKDLPGITDFFIKLNIDRIQFDFIQPLGMAFKNLDLLVPRITEVIPFVKKAIDIGLRANKYIGTLGIPYCLLSDYFKYTQEYKRAKSGGSTDNLPFKQKGKVCKECAHKNLCEGPWQSYVKYFGWKEFGN